MPLSAAHRAALKQLYTALADRVLIGKAQFTAKEARGLDRKSVV